MRLLACLIVLAIPVTSGAQRDETYVGYNFAFGIGRGSMSLKCKGCETTAQADLSGLVRVGYTIKENLFAGAEVVGLQKAQIVNLETVQATFVFGGGVVQWYPRRYGDGFLKFGAGWSHSSGTFNVGTAQQPTKLELNTPTVLAGLGFDVRMGRTFSLTPYVDFYYAIGSDATLGANTAPVTVNSSVLNLGVALTYH
jgi:hypothetical protein